jgi:general secretion pathway protein J
VNPSRSGFTLVEVLVSLAIFSLLAAAGAAVLGQAIDNRFAVKAAADRTAELQRMRGLLRADIGQAAPRRARGPTGRPTPQPMVVGSSSADPVLILVRTGWTNPSHERRASLQRVEYRLIQDRLERRVSPHLDGSRPGAPQVLFRGVTNLSVTFLRDGTEAAAYLPTPDRPLPEAVRLRATLEGYGTLDQLFLVGGA